MCIPCNRLYNFESIRCVVFDKYRYSISSRYHKRYLTIVSVLIIAEHLNWCQNIQNFIGNKNCYIQNHPKPNRYFDKIDFRKKKNCSTYNKMLCSVKANLVRKVQVYQFINYVLIYAYKLLR